jgi:glyoxylase-like metal-dependent hydrolase (beta-lactamase superfamily II)
MNGCKLYNNYKWGKGSNMEKQELFQGMIQYSFDPKPDQHFGNNIIALINNKQALLIDTGYEQQAKEVMDDLNKMGIRIEKVIISHFHEDHMQGLKSLPGVTVYGSCHYIKTLNLWTAKEEQIHYTPTILVHKNMAIDFGPFHIIMNENPGHSLCTMLININDEFLYVADEMMFSASGTPILPCITRNDIINSYVSVHNLRKYSHLAMIPGHGRLISDKECIESMIKNICLYFCEILSHDDRLSYEQATKWCTCDFLHKEYHENLYQE